MLTLSSPMFLLCFIATWTDSLGIVVSVRLVVCSLSGFLSISGQVGLGVGSWPSNRATEGSNPK